MALSLRIVIVVGAVIGLSILGDSLMYGILPLDAEGLGIPLTLVGVLLSANRLVRLASNSWASLIFERLGPRLPFAGAAALGLITTALYGTGWGFVVFLLARLLWGIAWSGLRQGGYQAVWSGDDSNKGRLMGILWGVVRLGSIVSVLAGGYLRDRFGYRAGVWAIASATMLALPVALSIRWPKSHTQLQVARQRPWQGLLTAFQTAPRRSLLMVGFLSSLTEAVLTSTASLFLQSRLSPGEPILNIGIGIGTIAGALLAVHWTSGIVFGPAIGALSDRLGQGRTVVLLVIILLGGISGAIFLLSGKLSLVLFSVVLIAGSGLFVTLSAAASGLATRSERPHIYMGAFATAIDAGSAMGPLIAYSLRSFVGLSPVYLSTGSLLLLAALRYWRAERKSGSPKRLKQS